MATESQDSKEMYNFLEKLDCNKYKDYMTTREFRLLLHLGLG